MLSENKTTRRHNKLVVLIMMLTATLFATHQLQAEEQHSFARQIRQYADEDKVYLLENIRQKVTIPSEKIVVDALLSEDGPKAVALYRKQLAEYPDPVLDPLSTSRIAAYNSVLSSPEPTIKLTRPGAIPRPPKTEESKKPPVVAAAKDPTPAPVVEKSTPVKKRAGGFTLQFGSFSARENAEILLKKLSPTAPAEIILDNGMYKVRLKESYGSKQEAAAATRSVPVEGIVVPLKAGQH